MGEKKATCCHRTLHDCIFSLRGETVQINSFTFPYGSVLFKLDNQLKTTVGDTSHNLFTTRYIPLVLNSPPDDGDNVSDNTCNRHRESTGSCTCFRTFFFSVAEI